MKRANVVAGLAAVVLFMAIGFLSCERLLPEDDAAGAARSVAQALGEGSGVEGFARAFGPRSFDFPRDHGQHPEYRNEWWYFTGNLADAQGRRFGYQLTFFRIALAPGSAVSESRWRNNQLYMAHFAVSDIDGRTFHAFERFGRAGPGMAGADNPPLHLWVDDWEARATEPRGFPLRLRAAAEDVAIDLELVPTKPVVLNGDAGLSPKSAEPGNASYYYSIPRLETRGSVRTDGYVREVVGLSWLDREWSTSALGADQEGWDWFALHLDDGRDLMLYRLRRIDGTVDPASAGTFVEVNGTARPLMSDELDLRVLDHWTSPRTGIRYPARWRLRVAGLDLDLEVNPAFDTQELDVSVRYWEGAVVVRGKAGSDTVSGRGYMELAGYADSD